MIKIIEKDFLDDNFIFKAFTTSMSINDKITFKKNNVYYFGNYKQEKLNIIKNKIYKNKKSLLKAIERGVTFIIHGNSIELFNNDFKTTGINLFTAYEEKNIFKRKTKYVSNLKVGINSLNFRYKNLICFK